MSELLRRLSTVLGDRYRVERELGAGGMATVYLAADLKHARSVAIKVLRPELAAVVGAERFLTEIRTTANLQHPHILPLFDSGEADGLLWYAMPYVEGETLRERIDREKQLPVDEAVTIVAKVLAALGTAHDQGIVHRDVKPANVLIGGSGEPLIADFGIALAVQEASGGRLTETGLSLGTPYYMSPEQATGDRDPDARSDLYSVGCMLYEMLTGEPPFGGTTARAIVGRILTAEPAPPTGARRTIPANVEAAVLTALEKTPADRFTSAADFTAALRDDGYRRGPPGSEAGERRGRAANPPGAGAWRAAALTLGALCAVLGTVLLWPEDASPEREPVWVEIALENDASTGVFDRMDLSPDGRRLVYVGSEAGRQTLWLRELSDPVGRPLPGTEGAVTPSFSPTGDRVAFVSYSSGARALKVASLQGGPVVTLTDDRVDAGGVRWGDDGYIYYDTGFDVDGFSRIPEDGSGPPELLTEPPEGSWQTPQDVLPGGRGVLFFNRDPLQIGVLDLETMETKGLVEGVGARYAHSGHLLWADASSTLFAAPFDLETLELTGTPIAIAGEVRALSFGMVDLALSETGVMLHGIGSSIDLPVIQFVGGTGETVGAEKRWPGLVLDLAGAPAGDRLVARVQELDGDRDLWLSDDDGAPTRITFTGDAGAPVFTPDGSSVLFPRYAEGGTPHLGLFRLGLDPLGTPEQVLSDPVVLPRIVDGGQGPRLVATAEGGSSIGQGLRPVRSWPLDRAGSPTGAPDTLFVQRDYTGDASVSPDGRWLLFSHVAGGSPQVKVKPWPGPSEAEWTISESVGAMPLWSADGSFLTWVDPAAGRLYRIPVQDGISFRTGEPSSVPAPPGLTWIRFVQQLTSGFTAEARPILLQPERDRRGLMLVTELHRILEERMRE